MVPQTRELRCLLALLLEEALELRHILRCLFEALREDGALLLPAFAFYFQSRLFITSDQKARVIYVLVY